MSSLHIRNRSNIYITFIRDIDELKEFTNNYLPGRPLVIGDISTFSNKMRLILLKFIEENPSVSCYSSEDLVDPILQSRFIDIIKEPLKLQSSVSVENYLESDHSYQSAEQFLSSSYDVKLRVPNLKGSLLKYVLNGQSN